MKRIFDKIVFDKLCPCCDNIMDENEDLYDCPICGEKWYEVDDAGPRHIIQLKKGKCDNEQGSGI